MGGFQSGQMGQTVNLLAKPSEVRILPPPPFLFSIQKKFLVKHIGSNCLLCAFSAIDFSQK